MIENITSRSPLLVVDGDNLTHRAYHSTPKTIQGANGLPINAIVGFFGMLLRVFNEEKPRGIFIAWDTLGVDTYRTKLWPPYQGGRVFDPEIVQQLNLLPEICEAFGFGVGKCAGYEADDFMAAAALEEVRQGGTALVLTTDKDAYQLCCEEITILSPQRGTRTLDRIGPSEVVQRFGVLPEQVPDFKALSGDSSDKIPGLPGIGPKSAASLLLRHGTLENVLENWSKPQEVELAFRFREVARMKPNCEVTLPSASPDWGAGAEVLKTLGANNLAERLSQV